MTLILALANKNFVVQISDRRLSSNGRLVDDESNKCGVVYCLNARMAFGYTGLARWRTFSTPKWLMKLLHDSASPDYTIGEILERVREKANQTFKDHPVLRDAPRVHKRVTVMFTGFINLDGTPRPGCAILSNYQDLETNSLRDEASTDFRIGYSSARPGVSDPTLVQRVGNRAAMTDGDVAELRALLQHDRPSRAIVGKGLEFVREMADRPRSSGTIGKQLTSIVIHKDPASAVESSYSSDHVKSEAYMPSLAFLLPGKHMIIEDVTLRPASEIGAPISVPKVRKNAPCPCGSDRKYKHCHGK